MSFCFVYFLLSSLYDHLSNLLTVLCASLLTVHHYLRIDCHGNNDSNDTLFNICLKNGLLITVLLIMSFIAFCSYSRILEINQLWVINLFLLLMGVYDSLEEYSPTGKSDSIDYFEGFKVEDLKLL